MKTFDEIVPTRSLPDLCTDAFTFALHLKNAESSPDIDSLRHRCGKLFDELRNKTNEAGIPQESFTLAGYALVALLDEIILTSDWPLRDEWMGKPMQVHYFQSFAAGEEFYTKLEGLREQTDDPDKLDVLEVYYLCLALGFRGKHGDVHGLETLKKLRQQLAQELAAARKRRPSAAKRAQQLGRSGTHNPALRGRRETSEGLSPRWKPPDSGQSSVTKELPIRAVVAVSLLFLLVLYVVLAGVLASGSSSAVEGAAAAVEDRG